MKSGVPGRLCRPDAAYGKVSDPFSGHEVSPYHTSSAEWNLLFFLPNLSHSDL